MKSPSILLCAVTMSSSLLFLEAAHGSTFQIVYSFCSSYKCADGAAPYSPRLLRYGDKLYGTTYLGGEGGVGTIFTIDVKTGAERVEHSFSETDPAEGANPIAGLTNVNGIFYGTTRDGGLYEVGTVFSFDPSSRSAKVLYSFNNQFGSDAYFPQAGVVKAKDALYGTTVAGGDGYNGTVFSFNLNTGTESVVYSFNGRADGGIPEAGLTNLNGALYSTTYNGGTQTRGTVFKFDPKTGTEAVLHSFPTADGDGISPESGLINVDGILSGTTSQYGKHDGGTVFSFDPTHGREKTLYSFCRRRNCADGANPGADLLSVKGVLYGTTANGGRYGWGTVFSLNLSTGMETVVHSFNQTDGAMPLAPLTEVNGKLFGTTQRGALEGGGQCFQYGCGTVFSIVP